MAGTRGTGWKALLAATDLGAADDRNRVAGRKSRDILGWCRSREKERRVIEVVGDGMDKLEEMFVLLASFQLVLGATFRAKFRNPLMYATSLFWASVGISRGPFQVCWRVCHLPSHPSVIILISFFLQSFAGVISRLRTALMVN
jgi:hypothetical protein